MRVSIKHVLRRISIILPLRFLPLDAALRFSQWMTSVVARLVFMRDWQLEASGRPQFFKHQINLGCWPVNPSKWAFAARGVYAREGMFSGCKVLDLCCGDGSYSYLFFSDIAGKIDAVDNDSNAVAYARRYSAAPNIEHYKLDIVNQEFPSNAYDAVVWNAAICYFTEEQIDRIFVKIVSAAKPACRLSGMLPKANAWPDHKTEFADIASVRRLLSRYFGNAQVWEINEGVETTFYFRASQPFNANELAHASRLIQEVP